jgi:hypothetical protein
MLAAGLVLPWLLGVTVVLFARSVRRPLDGPGEAAWIAGTGYLVGALLLTLWMRTLSIAGVRFGVIAIAGPLLALAMVLGIHVRRRDGDAVSSAMRTAFHALLDAPELHGGARLAWRLLLAWIALRFVLLGLDVAWQPLYPWDAWTQWATKARVWYELGRLVPFASADAWFAADGAAYFDAWPDHPPTLPLLQVWTCIALGHWDDTLMNWTWWQVAAALAAAVYGALRSLEVSALGALVATFLVTSLPLANIHVALAGYPDLPMAAYYACAVAAFLRWVATRDRYDAALVALLAFACTQIVNPGLGWALTLVPGLIVALLPRTGLKIATAGLAALLFLLAVAAQTSFVIMGHTAHLQFAPAWPAFGESYFVLGSWNLLWYGVIVVVPLAGRSLVSPALAPLTLVAAAGALFVLAVFAFPAIALWLGDQITLNRVTLQFAPVAIIFTVLAFHAFSMRWISAAADGRSARPAE